MPLTKLQFKPGINREGTNYSNEGGWFDGDKIRFKSGYVERIGGWERVAPTDVPWFVPQHVELRDPCWRQPYVYGDAQESVPRRRRSVLRHYPLRQHRHQLRHRSNPNRNGIGSGIVTITAVAHGSSVGDYVTISGAVGFDGITDEQLNQNFEILTVPTTDSFTIDTGGSATAGATAGGGSSVVASMEIAVGLDVTILVTVGAQVHGAALLGVQVRGPWLVRTCVCGLATLGARTCWLT